MDSVKVQGMASLGDAILGHFDNDLEHLLVPSQLKGERLGEGEQISRASRLLSRDHGALERTASVQRTSSFLRDLSRSCSAMRV